MADRLLTLATQPFEAALHRPSLPRSHPAHGLHGHRYLARVMARLPAGWAPFPGGEGDALADALSQAVAPLHYGHLNDHLTDPSDDHLARWLKDRLSNHLSIPGITWVGVQSTPEGGTDLNNTNHGHVWRKFRFEAAHQLPNVPPGHPCGRLHGHGFEVILHAGQPPGEEGKETTSDALNRGFHPLHQRLHHRCLNDLPGLENPTSERLAAWLWQQLKPHLPTLAWITVYETVTAGCNYDGQHFRIWKDRRFEAALALANAPLGEARRLLHGHSYLTRLHLCAPLDEQLGWTIDYGEIKAAFDPLYRQLDHHFLNDLDGLSNGDSASVLAWVRAGMKNRLPFLDRIDLYDRPGCGAALCWGEEGPVLPV